MFFKHSASVKFFKVIFEFNINHIVNFNKSILSYYNSPYMGKILAFNILHLTLYF